jgi:hypothetical protein
MTTRPVRRYVTAILCGLLLAVGPAARVGADPAGPTDYQSVVTEITPATPHISARILGGDSFLSLKVAPGSEVFVKGYAAELYLWIDGEGTVWQNRRSPATYYNLERYGAEIPEIADATADPEWERIGSGHEWAWHDHRIHRMESFAPLNTTPGDQILDAVVPVIVDGVAVDIHVISAWALAPSPLPTLGGIALGLLALGWWWYPQRTSGVITRRSLRRAAVVLAIGAVAALVIGVWQFISLPGSTGPLWTWWILPGVAVAAALSAYFGAQSSVASGGAGLAIAGSQLLVWIWERRTGLWRAILPTEAPWWLDRAVTAAVTPIALGGICLGLWVLGTGFIPARWRSQP